LKKHFFVGRSDRGSATHFDAQGSLCCTRTRAKKCISPAIEEHVFAAGGRSLAKRSSGRALAARKFDSFHFGGGGGKWISREHPQMSTHSSVDGRKEGVKRTKGIRQERARVHGAKRQMLLFMETDEDDGQGVAARPSDPLSVLAPGAFPARTPPKRGRTSVFVPPLGEHFSSCPMRKSLLQVTTPAFPYRRSPF